MLRKQQQQLENLAADIYNGRSQVNEIFLAWGVGSGKSLSPVILSELLTNGKRQVVVVPRNSLKAQGESGYNNDIYPVDKTARIASNCGDPFRGCDACFVSYQGIAANPEMWIRVFQENECMLVLDEFHHLSEGGLWVNTIKKMKELSFLTAYLSGTIFRGDNLKIPFVPYDEKGNIIFTNTDKRQWIIYSSKQALKDGAVLPFESITVDGSGSYVDLEGFTRNFEKFTGDSNQLRCSFKSEYANHMIDLSLSHWIKYRETHPWAKILIVSPDIATAKEYTSYIQAKYPFIQSAIATSEDSAECRDNIKRLKQENGSYNYIDCLVNVGICYEGLDVVQASHIVALTLIRSLPWLTQMTGRVIRRYPSKECGYVFTPADPKMIKALKDIDGGIIKAADAEPEQKQKTTPTEDDELRPPTASIQALYSHAHIQNPYTDAPALPQIQETQSEKEKRLKKSINTIVSGVVLREDPGNRKVKERIIWLRIKQQVNNGRDKTGKIIKKALKEMTIPELKTVETYLKATFKK